MSAFEHLSIESIPGYAKKQDEDQKAVGWALNALKHPRKEGEKLVVEVTHDEVPPLLEQLETIIAKLREAPSKRGVKQTKWSHESSVRHLDAGVGPPDYSKVMKPESAVKP